MNTRILDSNEYLTELRIKLQEEMNGFLAAKSSSDAVEELADMLEVIHALAERYGASVQELERIRAEKTDKRGGFKDRIYLIEVEDA